MKVFCKMFTVIIGIVIASLSFSEEAFSSHRKKEKEKSIVTLDCKLELVKTHRIGRFLHSVFGEFFGDVIYDGIWVGKDSKIPNIDGLRKDVIEGCREAGVTAFRWPGGCCADHYHWKDGVGPVRKNRIHPKPRPYRIWRHDFGTDEFIHFCRLIDAEPILVANVATGTPAEFFDWFEYCNGDKTTKYGSLRAANGHREPYNVGIWGIGNTDENVWHIDFNNPVAYAQNFLRWRTAILDFSPEVRLIGLGLSWRHGLSGWVEAFLDHVTFGQENRGPNSLSVHHYIGGIKERYKKCGPAVNYSDESYYFTINAIQSYQKDIDLHREYIKNHTSPKWPTTISFDEWGLWHPEATKENGIRQPQTMRDAIFAAMALHTFYRNSDIVEYAMETQVTNLLQSLFETDGARFYKTPTFYVFKLFKEHLEQCLIPMTGYEKGPMLDCVASATDDLKIITLSLVNKNLYHSLQVKLPENLSSTYFIQDAQIIAPKDVRSQNTFDNPDEIAAKPYSAEKIGVLELPKYSITRIIFNKK